MGGHFPGVVVEIGSAGAGAPQNESSLLTSFTPPTTGVCTATVPTVPAANCVPNAIVGTAWMLTAEKAYPAAPARVVTPVVAATESTGKMGFEMHCAYRCDTLVAGV